MLLLRKTRSWHGSAAMNRLLWLLLCISLWQTNARPAELDARAVAFYYPGRRSVTLSPSAKALLSKRAGDRVPFWGPEVKIVDLTYTS